VTIFFFFFSRCFALLVGYQLAFLFFACVRVLTR
jgi:hypothetical protein